MSDLKLFRFANGTVAELPGHSAQIEKSLQALFEKHLATLLGVTFLATEYSTGKAHGGRIDTLGIDENGCPVIIEYKRSINENVINQGLFYLDWLLDHKKEFQWLVMEKLGPDAAKGVEWSAPRLVCIAGDFTRYDEHAVKQINRNIELIRYRHYGDDLLLLDLVNAQSATPTAFVEAAETAPGKPAKTHKSDHIRYRYEQSPAALRDAFHAVKDFLVGLGDDVQIKELQNYFAFKRLKNFACLEIYPQAGKVVVFVKVDPKSVTIEEGFTRDVTDIGHFGTGDLEITLRKIEDVARAQPLLMRSYEGA